MTSKELLTLADMIDYRRECAFHAAPAKEGKEHEQLLLSVADGTAAILRSLASMEDK